MARTRAPQPVNVPDSVAQALVARDLFRLGRRPAPTRYDPGRDQGPGLAQQVRPQLVLRGVMMTDTARALLEGFPGVDGSRLLRTGDSLAGFRVISISRTQVRVAGLDTTWVLPLRRVP